MDALVLLADSASQEGQPGTGGKIHALGIGWSQTVTPTPPAAVLVFFRVPWTAANQRHTFRLELLDEDGQPVTVPSGDDAVEDPPLFVEGQFELGRPAGLPHGSELTNSFCAGIGPGLNLTIGRAYEWRLTVDGTHEPAWKARFFVRGIQPIGP